MSEVQTITGVVSKRFDGKTKTGKNPGKSYSIVTVEDIDAFCFTPSILNGVVEGAKVEMKYLQTEKGCTLKSIDLNEPAPETSQEIVPIETEEGIGEMEQTQALAQKSTVTPAVATQSPPEPFKDPYEGIATQSFSKEQRDILTAPIAPEDVSIKPTGEVYYDQMKYRIKLNGAFGAGAWGMRPLGKPVFEGGEITCGYDLIVMGGFVARAYGSQKWYPNNKRMTKADAVDSTKSDSLKKCCKDIGVATECWDKKFIREFKNNYCVLVKVKPPMNGLSEVWRRKDAPPFKDETGTVTKETQEPVDAEFENVSANAETKDEPETLQTKTYRILNQAFENKEITKDMHEKADEKFRNAKTDKTYMAILKSLAKEGVKEATDLVGEQ